MDQLNSPSWGMMLVSGVLVTGVRTWRLLLSATYVRQDSALSFLMVFGTSLKVIFLASVARSSVDEFQFQKARGY